MSESVNKLRRAGVFPACTCHNCGQDVPAGKYSEQWKYGNPCDKRRICGPCIQAKLRDLQEAMRKYAHKHPEVLNG